MAKHIFDHLKGVTKDKLSWNSLSDADKKSWDDYMITRWLSMYPEYIEYVNELQSIRNTGMDSREYYNMLLYSLPKKYSYIKYIKKPNTFENKKELLTFLSNAYKTSKRECLDIINIFRSLKLNDEFDVLMQTHGLQEDEKEKLRKEMFDAK